MPRRSSNFRTRQTGVRRQQTFESEAYGRLLTSRSKSRIPLPVRRPQNYQNENHRAITPTETEIMAADAEISGNSAKRISRWSEGDVSTHRKGESTGIRTSPGSVASAYDFELPFLTSVPPLDGAPLDLKIIESTPRIRKSSTDYHVIGEQDLTHDGQSQAVPSGRSQAVPSEPLMFPALFRENDDHLRILDGDEHGLGSIFTDAVQHPDLVSNTRNDSRPIPHFPYAMELESNQHDESFLDKRNEIHSAFGEPQDQLPLSQTLDQLELSSPDRDHELTNEPEVSHLMAGLIGPDYPASDVIQEDWIEPEMEWANSEGLDTHQLQSQKLDSKISDHQLNLAARPTTSEPTSESYVPQSTSQKQGEDRLISIIQSSLASGKSQKRGKIWGQQRRRHRFLVRNLINRAEAYKKRVQLRQSRLKISTADENFMKLVRERRVQGNKEDSALEECYRSLQDARNEYGPLEDAYNETEEQLDREEFEAKELEEQIMMRDVSPAGSDSGSGSSSTSEVESEPPVIVNHPLYDKYVSHTWEAEHCREEIADLLIERKHLLQSQELRQRVGMELAPEDQLRLQDFPAAEAKLLDQLKHVEAETENSRLACIREGLLNEQEYNDDEDEGGEIILDASSVGVVAPEQADYNKYHILMEKPQNKEDGEKSKVLLTDFTEGDVGDRITCWLLHKLRLSGLEVERLARYADGLDRSVDTEKWQEKVLEFWFVDSANLESSAYVGKPTLTANTPVQMGFDSNFGNIYEIKMIVRSSALSQRLEIDRRLKLKRTNGRSVITE